MHGERIFSFLGTGTSVGVPMVGCDCAVCCSNDRRNQRTRSSVLLTLPQGNILIDTGPELRVQLLREKVKLVHAVLFTHYHADHLFGLDDVRPFPKVLNRCLPIYCSEQTEEIIRQTFAYAFTDHAEKSGFGAVPRLEIRTITGETSFSVLGQRITPIPLIHATFNVFGFRIDDVAYCTDVNEIPRSSWPLLRNLRVLVLGALRHKPHPAHFSLSQALEVIDRLQPERAYLTHISHDLDHDDVSHTLPRNVELAYDGLRFFF